MEINGQQSLLDTQKKFINTHIIYPVNHSGPSLILFCGFMLLGFITIFLTDEKGQGIFKTTLIFIYIFSLMLTISWQFVIIRFFSCRSNLNDNKAINGAFLQTMFIIIMTHFLAGALFLFFSDFSLLYKLVVMLCFVIIGCNLQFTIFLSLLRMVKGLIFIFLLLSILSISLGIVAGQQIGLAGYWGGLLTGQSALFILFSYIVFEQFAIVKKFNWVFLKYIFKNYGLLCFGILIAWGLGVDKIIFWLFNQNQTTAAYFPLTPQYDLSQFLAFITAIPIFLYFFIILEKRLYDNYKVFIESIILKHNLKSIEGKGKIFVNVIIEGFYDILKIQLPVTLSAVYFAPHIFGVIKIPLDYIPFFRSAVWGVSLFSLIILIIVILLYLEQHKYLIFIGLLFFISNSILSFVSITLFPGLFGYGFSLASLITLIYSLGVSYYCLNNLIYFVFNNTLVIKR